MKLLVIDTSGPVCGAAVMEDEKVLCEYTAQNRNTHSANLMPMTEAALQAADTGHLVLTTLHATNSTQSITRILDFYQKDEQDSVREALATNLAAIISQRLVPRAMGNGRVPAWEIMLNTPVISKLIQDNRLEKLPAAIMGGDSDGMASFNMSLLQLVNDGIITEEDALEASDNPDSLRMNFEGIFLSADNGGIIGDRSV